MRINPDRPMEEMQGSNVSYLRHMMGRVHCSLSFRDACRQVLKKRKFRKLRREYSVAFRRGVFKCLYEIWKSNREVWRQFS